jgi:hypothetical protein
MKRKNKMTHKEVTAIEELQQFKEFLGPIADRYTPAEVRQLRDEMRIMADILLDFYLLKRKERKQRHIRF